MSLECGRCARTSQLYLCSTCVGELRDMLHGLAEGQKLPNGQHAAGWLEFLEDAALGRTRLGESARRSTERNTPIPVNLTASQLLTNTHEMLIHWTEQINTNFETLALEEDS